ncbi:MAG: serine/threonine protein kinase [Deltaproteobacteria bacterium]|nr:MAG: serine/threonine protein kinase [Deltaproteobacteria bacterium]
MKCPNCCQFIPSRSEVCPRCKIRLRGNVPLTQRSPARHLERIHDLPLPDFSRVPVRTPPGEERGVKWRVGDRIQARYQIKRILGEGGMGEVYEAFDTKLERPVAIKRTLPIIRTKPNTMRRFLTEAKSIARLRHKNVVQIYDIIEFKDDPCIVMEFIEGPSLFRLITRKGRIPLEETLSLIEEIADGLSAIHAEGVVHRDIKPSNILLDRWGVPKLIDFGLAKILDPVGESRSRLREGITISGTAIGTWEYASPEQMKNAKRVDARTDVYSLGATMYHMLTGDAPRHFRESEIPEAVRSILLTAMARDLDFRFPDMEMFRQAIRALRCKGFTGGKACSFCGGRNPDPARFCMFCTRAFSASA